MAGPLFSAKVEGLDRLLKDLQRRSRETEKATRAALLIEGEELMTEAKKLTPVDEGNLRASGHVQISAAGQALTVNVGFGGPAGSGTQNETNPEDVGYAVPVHEDLTKFHKVGQAKYLEAPFNRRKDGLTDRLVKRVRARLSR